jgi:hypothetical protein
VVRDVGYETPYVSVPLSLVTVAFNFVLFYALFGLVAAVVLTALALIYAGSLVVFGSSPPASSLPLLDPGHAQVHQVAVCRGRVSFTLPRSVLENIILRHVLKEALAVSRVPLLVVHPIVSPVDHDTEGRAPDHLTTEQTEPAVTTLSLDAVHDFVGDARSVVVRPPQGLLFRSHRPSLATGAHRKECSRSLLGDLNDRDVMIPFLLEETHRRED